MISDKERIGRELKTMIRNNYSIQYIANWAYNLSLDPNSFSQDLKTIIEDLAYMEAGPEFVLSKEKIDKIANQLIMEGEKEELSQPIKGISDHAKYLDETWLLCPICQEAWESKSCYGMVRCPHCQRKLHNPRYIRDC